MDEHLDSLRPELTPFCSYVRSWVLAASSEDDELNWEFIAKELIIMCSFYDLGDEVWSMSREWGVGSREFGIGSMELGGGSRE